MKLLYATSNTLKIYNMKRRLKDTTIEVITPEYLNIKLEINENGKTEIENAIKKAEAYYKKTNLPIIAGDTGLYIEGLSKDKQPGLNVRRINGKRLNDEELLIYYRNLIESLGGQTFAYNITGLALITDTGLITKNIKEDNVILTNTPSMNTNHKGNPLDIITIDPSTHKYYVDLTDEEFTNLSLTFERECKKFIMENLREDASNKHHLILK